MKKIYKIALLALLAALALAAACSGGDESTPEEEDVGPPAPGKRAPAFSLEDLAGETVTLADYRGQPVVLNFWASWCGPCQMETPVFEWLAQNEDWQAEDVVVLGVNQGESATMVASFGSYFGITFPLLLDTDYAVSDAYNVRYLPTTFFIDKDGIINEIKIGAITSADSLEASLNDLITDD